MKKRIRKLLLCVLLIPWLVLGARPASSAQNAQKETAPTMRHTNEDIIPASAMRSLPYLSLPLSPFESLPALTREDVEGLTLSPGGMPFGVRFVTEGVMVVGFCDVETQNGKVNPAAEAGLRQKDMILAVNGETLSGASDLTDRIEASGGNALKLSCRRGGRSFEVTLKPAYCPAESRYKTGIWVRDSGAGIGTVTFIIPDTGAFAGLGHGICDADTGALIPMKRGTVSDVTISSVVKGAPGAPGELKGYFNAGKTGSLLGNCACGVWGVFSDIPDEAPEPMPVGLRDDLKEGKAEILCTLDSNKMERYDVKISNISRDATGSKCFTVTVTDPDLIALTGGIVQGMSGSPIIQNGKLIGAVTHVLINDPTRGYGIFLENMLVGMPLLAQ
ncbi:MAG: SpoIVB peptidase [Clostridia bacterium]|nr:SpoIVB peptidase [Clostridia bacterium]